MGARRSTCPPGPAEMDALHATLRLAALQLLSWSGQHPAAIIEGGKPGDMSLAEVAVLVRSAYKRSRGVQRGLFEAWLASYMSARGSSAVVEDASRGRSSPGAIVHRGRA